jgi:hypothetical protein
MGLVSTPETANVVPSARSLLTPHPRPPLLVPARKLADPSRLGSSTDEPSGFSRS